MKVQDVREGLDAQVVYVPKRYKNWMQATLGDEEYW